MVTRIAATTSPSSTPLPAGLKAINPALATTGTVDPAPRHHQRRKQLAHEARLVVVVAPLVRPPKPPRQRVEAFTTLLWEGVHSYSYTARATTPGNFVVPARPRRCTPPRPSAAPASDRVIVE